MRQARRSFLGAIAGAAAVAPVSRVLAAPAGPRSSTRRRPRIGVSTYSFWHFKEHRVEVPDCIEKAAEMGFDGVEILHRQMSSESNAYLQDLKRRAFVNGLDVMGVLILQGFVSPDPAERGNNAEATL